MIDVGAPTAYDAGVAADVVVVVNGVAVGGGGDAAEALKLGQEHVQMEALGDKVVADVVVEVGGVATVNCQSYDPYLKLSLDPAM